MALPPHRAAGLAFLFAALLSALAALYPLARGRSAHATFGILALGWLVIGLVQLRRARPGDRDGAG